VVNYVLTYPSFISLIYNFAILRLPLADNALLSIRTRISSLASPPLLSSHPSLSVVR